MVYFLFYGDEQRPRFFFTDLTKAREWAKHYIARGYSNVSLGTASDYEAMLDVADNWVAWWGSDMEEIQQQRMNEAQQLRNEAEKMRPKPSAIAALICGQGTKEDYRQAAMFGFS
jgi:hypothetical protein